MTKAKHCEFCFENKENVRSTKLKSGIHYDICPSCVVDLSWTNECLRHGVENRLKMDGKKVTKVDDFTVTYCGATG